MGQMIMWPVRALFGGDIPGIDDVAEASLDYTSNLSSNWYLVSYWLKLVSLLLKEAIHPFIKFDETSLVKYYPWYIVLWGYFDGDLNTHEMYADSTLASMAGH